MLRERESLERAVPRRLRFSSGTGKDQGARVIIMKVARIHARARLRYPQGNLHLDTRKRDTTDTNEATNFVGAPTKGKTVDERQRGGNCGHFNAGGEVAGRGGVRACSR